MESSGANADFFGGPRFFFAVSAASASWSVLAVLLAGAAPYCIFTGGTIALTAAVMDFVLAGIDVLYALFFVLYDWRGSAV